MSASVSKTAVSIVHDKTATVDAESGSKSE
jgi:hypothetical protein